jgi:Tol biopolymer transport system component
MLSADELTLMFTSLRPGGQGDLDLWVSTRSRAGEPFGKPVNLGPAVNSRVPDSHPCLSADGLMLWFNSDRSGRRDLYEAVRAAPDKPWGKAVSLGPAVNAPDHWDSDPCVSADGRTLLFDSERPGGCGGKDLWMSTRSGTRRPWGRPINLGLTVNSSHSDCSPWLSGDGRTLYFSSDRPGGRGGQDLYCAAVRPPESPPDTVALLNGWRVGKPVNLGAMVNSAGNDVTNCVSSDGRTLVFASDRPGGSGLYDLWWCKKRTADQRWSRPVNLGAAVNHSRHDTSPALSIDGLALVLTSLRPGG